MGCGQLHEHPIPAQTLRGRKEGLERNQVFAQWPVHPCHPSPDSSGFKMVSLIFLGSNLLFMTDKNDKTTDLGQVKHAKLVTEPADEVRSSDVRHH